MARQTAVKKQETTDKTLEPKKESDPRPPATATETTTELQQDYFGSNYYEQYGDSISRTNIVGRLLKFDKGDYLVGKDAEEFDAENETLVAIMDELYIGWMKWVDGKPEQQLMGKVSEGFQPKRRKELGDGDESEWEVDSEGKPRDPWQFTNQLVLRRANLAGQVDEDEDMFTFSTSSKGGLGAVGDLCKSYGKMMRQHAGEYPVVQFGTDSYMHSDKSRGRIKVPTIEIVGWEAAEVAPEPPKIAPPKTAAKNVSAAPAAGRRR